MFTRPYLESAAVVLEDSVDADTMHKDERKRMSTMPCAPREEALPQLRAVDDIYGPDSLPTPLPPPSKTGIDGRYALIGESGVIAVGEVSKLDLVEANDRMRSLLQRVLSASVNDMPALVVDIRAELSR